ncbi:hypothetical protein Dda_5784 [Drechslerella dactyloides]|uniref:alpha-galactosidase n=1 Tax=Drechslerella dactyloides TaxID=74499 RepID=A0AAD6IVU1_DREDA|nr:hypothetical protein Dda_5784 [Drechslerella dactyloides]
MQLFDHRISISLLFLLALSQFTLFNLCGAVPVLASRDDKQLHPEADKRSELDSSPQEAPPLGGRAASSRWWVPTQSTTWQVQLSGTVDKRFNGNAIEFDADTDTATVKYFKSKGIKTIAYISAGSLEDWRIDVKSFPKVVIGRALAGWPGEYWLDIRQVNILKKLMLDRLSKAKAKGFDGVDWDNVDGYTQDSGFKITYEQQLAYNKMLSEISHGLGMTVALKNDLEQIRDLVGYFDFAVNEECGYYRECTMLAPFLNAGKAVVGLEYPGQGGDKRTYDQVKARVDPRSYTLIKKLDLGAWGIVLRTLKSVI